MTGPPFSNESEFVAWLRRITRRGSRGLELAIGDDAAVARLAPRSDLVLTADLSVEGVHFSRLDSPSSIGHRALARSLSDVAAMGGRPRFTLISLALASGTSRSWIERFYDGLLALARRFRVDLVGGDLAVSPGPAHIDAAVIGQVARGRALQRVGALPGDAIFISGTAGLAALGLRLLKERGTRRPGNRIEFSAIRAHLYPEPRCALGERLVARRLASAAIDVSDGLSTDLARLCEASGVGARIDANHIVDQRPDPTISDAWLGLALDGGDDYELLFTVRPRRIPHVPAQLAGVRLHRIGEITRSKRLLLIARDGSEIEINSGGWDHFRRFRNQPGRGPGIRPK